MKKRKELLKEENELLSILIEASQSFLSFSDLSKENVAYMLSDLIHDNNIDIDNYNEE